MCRFSLIAQYGLIVGLFDHCLTSESTTAGQLLGVVLAAGHLFAQERVGVPGTELHRPTLELMPYSVTMLRAVSVAF